MSRHSSFYSPSPSKTPPSHSKAAEYPTPSRSVLSRSAIETSQRATDDAKNELHRTRILLASALKELDHYKRKSATVLDEHDKSFKILVQERAFIYLESERAYFLNRLKALWGVQQRLRCKTRTFKCWRLAASQAAQIRRMQVILVNRVQRDQGMQLKSSAMMCLRTNTWSQSPHVMEDFAAMVKGFGLWRNCAHRESKAKVEGALEEAVKLGEDLTHDRKHLHKMTHNMFHVSVARMKNKNLKTRLFWQWMSHLATRRQQTRKLSQAGRLYRKKLALRSLQRWLLLLRRETARRLVLLATWGLVVHRRSLAGEGSDRDVLELVTGTMGMEGDSCLRGRAGSEEAAQRRSLLGWRKQVRWTRRARIVLCMLRSEQLTCFYMWKVLVSCLMRARRYKLQGVMTCWSEGSKSAHLRRVWNESYVDKVSIRRHRQRLQRVSLMGWAQVNRNMHVARRVLARRRTSIKSHVLHALLVYRNSVMESKRICNQCYRVQEMEKLAAALTSWHRRTADNKAVRSLGRRLLLRHQRRKLSSSFSLLARPALLLARLKDFRRSADVGDTRWFFTAWMCVVREYKV